MNVQRNGMVSFVLTTLQQFIFIDNRKNKIAAFTNNEMYIPPSSLRGLPIVKGELVSAYNSLINNNDLTRLDKVGCINLYPIDPASQTRQIENFSW